MNADLFKREGEAKPAAQEAHNTQISHWHWLGAFLRAGGHETRKNPLKLGAQRIGDCGFEVIPSGVTAEQADVMSSITPLITYYGQWTPWEDFTKLHSASGSVLFKSPEAYPVVHSEKFSIENERLKTRLMSESRATLTAQERATELETEKKDSDRNRGKLTDSVLALAGTNQALVSALLDSHSGRVRLHERHSGVVSETADDYAEVTYETEIGPLKQIYKRDQFVNSKLPKEGDAVVAHVFVAVVLCGDIGKDGKEATTELPTFADRATTDPLQI